VADNDAIDHGQVRMTEHHRMRTLAIVLGIIGFLFGLAAARYWFMASQIDPVPVWGTMEPVDQEQAHAGWIAGMLEAAAESASLNRRAARLTAIAVFFTTASSLASLFI
jgi:hypothetical protein